MESPKATIKSGRLKKTLAECYWEKVDVREPGECWPWTRKPQPTGYGAIGVADGRFQLAHRVGYELAFGPIPEDMVVDHGCHNRDPDCPGGACKHRACQNPAHFRLRTRGGNVLAGKTLPAANAAKTHCIRDHPFSSGNTYISPDGSRQCRRCRAEAQERCRQRRAAKQIQTL